MSYLLYSGPQCICCGADIEIHPYEPFAVCPYCHTRMSVSRFIHAEADTAAQIEALHRECGRHSTSLSGQIQALNDAFRASLDGQLRELFRQGENAQRRGDFDEAIAHYQRLLEKSPGESEVHWRIMLCRYGIEYVREAGSGLALPTITRMDIRSVLQDENYLSACRYAPDEEMRTFYQQEAGRITRILQQYQAMPRTHKPYDVFISVKQGDEQGRPTNDCLTGLALYEMLSGMKMHVFNSRKSLAHCAGTEYEPYVMHALSTAKVMIVVASCEEYMNSPWVKNEWRRFLWLREHKNPRLRLIAYIIGEGRWDMLPLGGLQIIRSNDTAPLETLRKSIREIRPPRKKLPIVLAGAALLCALSIPFVRPDLLPFTAHAPANVPAFTKAPAPLAPTAPAATAAAIPPSAPAATAAAMPPTAPAVAAAPTPPSAPVLSVAQIQKRLVELGWLSADQAGGKFDEATGAALLRFKQAVNECFPHAYLNMDSLPDSRTTDYLQWSSAPSAPPSAAAGTAAPQAALDALLFREAASYWALTPGSTDSTYGDSSDMYITRLQRALKELGYFTGTVSGVYDDRTTAAVAAFQLNNQIFSPDAIGTATAFTQTLLYHGNPFPASSPNPAPRIDPGNLITLSARTFRIDGIPSVKLTLTSQGTPQVYGFVVTCIPASNGVPLSSTHSYHLWETLTDLPRSFPITFDSVDPQSVDSVYIYISNIYYSDGRIYCREISSPDPQTCRLFSID